MFSVTTEDYIYHHQFAMENHLSGVSGLVVNMDPNNLDFPIGFPPPGVIPNFKNPESWAWETYLTVTICLSFMIIFVATRFYSRKYLTRSLGADDYLCAFAAIGAIVFAAMMIHLLHFGYGIHQWNVLFSRFTMKGFQFNVVYTVFYGFVLFVIKLSIFMLYLRLIPPFLFLRYLIYFGVGFVFLGNLAIPMALPIMCAPRGKENWAMSTLAPRCINAMHALSVSSAVVNLASDIYIICLPLPMVWKLQLAFRKKVGATMTFMTGLLAIAAGLARVIFFAKFMTGHDNTFWLQRTSIMAIIETNVGIICSCAPACVPVIRKLSSFLPTLRDWFYTKSGTSLSSDGTSQQRAQQNGFEQSRPKPVRKNYDELEEFSHDWKQPTINSVSLRSSDTQDP